MASYKPYDLNSLSDKGEDQNIEDSKSINEDISENLEINVLQTKSTKSEEESLRSCSKDMEHCENEKNKLYNLNSELKFYFEQESNLEQIIPTPIERETNETEDISKLECEQNKYNKFSIGRTKGEPINFKRKNHARKKYTEPRKFIEIVVNKLKYPAVEEEATKVDPDVAVKENVEVLDCSFDDLTAEEKIFTCNICAFPASTLERFINHFKELHTHTVEISDELEAKLHQQQELIIKVEKTASEMIASNQIKAAQSLLETSMEIFNQFTEEQRVLGKGPDIFHKSIQVMYSRVETLIKDKLIYIADLARTEADRRVPKLKIKHVKYKKPKVTNINATAVKDSDFSSDDDLCLKDSMMKSNSNIIINDRGEVCAMFYAVAVKQDGSQLAAWEISTVKDAVNNLWCDRDVTSCDFFNGLIVKRFVLEQDEIVPDDALFVGYTGNENDFDPKPFMKVFKNGLLDDAVLEHESLDAGHTDGEGEIKAEFQERYDLDFINKTDCLMEENHNKINLKKTCKACGKVFKSRQFYKNHIKKCKSKKCIVNNFNCCNECGEVFTSIILLKQHESEIHHLKTNIVQCEVCCYVFQTIEEKENHFSSHEKINNFLNCGICRKGFEDSDALKEHFKNKHADLDDIEIKQEVSESDEETKTAYYKKVKVTKDSADAPQCKICRRKFTSHGRLVQHTNISHPGRKRKLPRKHQLEDEVTSDGPAFVEVEALITKPEDSN